MTAPQGDLALLQDPVAQSLLNEQTIMRLAYIWTDGTPRVIPHWLHWNGREVVLGTPPDAPKVQALQANPQVALTIDTTEIPPRVLLIRGTAAVEIVDGAPPELCGDGAATTERSREQPGSSKSSPSARRWRASRSHPPGWGSSTSARAMTPASRAR